MKTKLKLAGFKGVDAALGEIEKTATKKRLARKALIEGAAPFVSAYSRLAPFDKGGLRGSIKAGSVLSKAQRKRHIRKGPVEVFAGAGPLPQAHVEEFGSINQPAQPAARPAWASEKFNCLARTSNVLAAAIDQSAKRQRKRLAKK